MTLRDQRLELGDREPVDADELVEHRLAEQALGEAGHLVGRDARRAAAGEADPVERDRRRRARRQRVVLAADPDDQRARLLLGAEGVEVDEERVGRGHQAWVTAPEIVSLADQAAGSLWPPPAVVTSAEARKRVDVAARARHPEAAQGGEADRPGERLDRDLARVAVAGQGVFEVVARDRELEAALHDDVLGHAVRVEVGRVGPVGRGRRGERVEAPDRDRTPACPGTPSRSRS